MPERRATLLDTIGKASRYLFARNKTTGQRISARTFYSLSGKGTYERGDFVLMTTKAAPKANETKEMF